MLIIWWSALLLRLALSVLPGLSWDVNAHLAWSLRLVHAGPAAFYGSLWCDYPPGYLYVLWLVGQLNRLWPPGAPNFLPYVLLKIPPIAADLAIGLVLVRWARAHGHGAHVKRIALWWLLNPAVWLISAVWGQVDSVVMLWIVLALVGLDSPRLAVQITAAAVYGLALLTKPQAVFFLPLIGIWMARRHRLRRLLALAASAAVSAMLLAWPFTGAQSWDWLWRLYRSTATEYAVTSVNAFNLWALAGLWRPDSQRLLGLSDLAWGVLAAALCIGWIVRRVHRAERPAASGALFLAAAGVVLSSFLFLTRMHERYAYYALPFLLLAALATGQRRWWWVYAGASAGLCLNLGYVLLYYAPHMLHWPIPMEPATRALYDGRWLGLAVAGGFTGLWGVVMRGLARPVSNSGPAPAALPTLAGTRRLPSDAAIAALFFLAAFSLYFVRLGQPPVEHYDEVHHVKAARLLLHVREPTEWTHPHLGKLAMAASMAVLGERPVAWRLPGVLAGSCTIALIYLLGVSLSRWPVGQGRSLGSAAGAASAGHRSSDRRHSLGSRDGTASAGGSRFIGGCAALLLLCDGLQFVISRIGMLDVYVTCFSLLAYLICARAFVMAWRPSRRAWWGLGVSLGLALASKWIAFYTYGAIGVLLAAAWWRARRADRQSADVRVPVMARRITVFLVLVPAIIYLLSYARYIQVGHSLTDLLTLQRSMWNYHARIAETHTYSSPWWSWPLIWRPVWTYFQSAGGGKIKGVVLLGNPAVFWIGLPCLLLAAWWALRRRHAGVVFLVTGFCFQYLPWGISPRKLLFFHHFYSALPFLCLAIAFCLRRLWERPAARWLVGAYLGAVIGLFWYFYPILAAVPIADATFRSHMWFRRWI